MKKLPLLFYWGATLLFAVAPLAAQNTLDVVNNGPQPPNTAGCAVLPHCIPAIWSTTSNAGTDISGAISANFVFASKWRGFAYRLSGRNQRTNLPGRYP